MHNDLFYGHSSDDYSNWSQARLDLAYENRVAEPDNMAWAAEYKEALSCLSPISTFRPFANT